MLQLAQTVVAHFLDALDVDVAKLDATSGIDRLAQALTWTELPTGEMVFDHVRAWLRCEIVERIQAGESTVLIARGLRSRTERDVQLGEPCSALVYHNRTWHHLGEHSRLDSYFLVIPGWGAVDRRTTRGCFSCRGV